MSNNALQNFNCPPLMNDGRQPGTDYRPDCDVNYGIIRQNGIKNSYDYRQFLIHNAESIMDLNRRYYEEQNRCDSCKFFHADPNSQETYWEKYTSWLGYKR